MVAFARSYIKYRDKPGSFIKRPHAASQSYAPGQICRDYNWPNGIAVQPLTIAIMELGGHFYPSDLSPWAARANLPVPVVNTFMLPGADDSPSDADGEVMLDVFCAAQAYSSVTGLPAKILIVYGPNTGQAFADITEYCNTLTGIGSGSGSWGTAETNSADSDRANLDAQLQRALFPWHYASGDNGSNDGTNTPTADWPSCSPYLASCGGTSKVPGSGAETVWNNGNGEGTGGGFSKFYGRPIWQPANTQGTGRMVPDWAAVADPNTGYDTLINGSWQVIGGTSAVAPLLAGFMCAVNGARLKLGLPMIAQPNQMIWSMLSSYYDIISGSNGAYNAEAGPDPCSGAGRPTATTFAMMTGASQVPPVLPPPVNSPPVNPPPATPAFVLTVPTPIRAGQTFKIKAGKAIAAGKYDCFPSSGAADAEVFAD
jgi:kumamolisin